MVQNKGFEMQTRLQKIVDLLGEATGCQATIADVALALDTMGDCTVTANMVHAVYNAVWVHAKRCGKRHAPIVGFVDHPDCGRSGYLADDTLRADLVIRLFDGLEV